MAISTLIRSGYVPVPYHQDSEDTVTCPDCGRMDAADANYCDQCDAKMDATATYSRGSDENVQCPECQLYNDDDAHFCDQCGVKLEGRSDIEASGSTPGSDDGSEGGDDDVDAPEEFSDTGTNPTGFEDGVSSSFSSKAIPKSNLVRDYSARHELRSDASGQVVQLSGIFSAYNVPYEISSWYEGDFIEVIAPGAFTETIANDLDAMRCLYDHGFDPQMGNKPIGPIRSLIDTALGPEYLVDFLDTSYNSDWVIPALQGKLISGEMVGSVLGASMRFEVIEDQWNMQPPITMGNPRMLPVRTVTRAKVMEFGPVTFPANPGATAGARSRTDEWLEHVVSDQSSMFCRTLGDRIGKRELQKLRSAIPREARMSGEAKRRQDVLRRRARVLDVTAARF